MKRHRERRALQPGVLRERLDKLKSYIDARKEYVIAEMKEAKPSAQVLATLKNLELGLSTDDVLLFRDIASMDLERKSSVPARGKSCSLRYDHPKSLLTLLCPLCFFQVEARMASTLECTSGSSVVTLLSEKERDRLMSSNLYRLSLFGIFPWRLTAWITHGSTWPYICNTSRCVEATKR